MYAWIFRHLPGPMPVRILISVALVSAVISGCFAWVFPPIAALLEGGSSVASPTGGV